MKKQITQLVDDLDGTVIDGGGSTVRFSLEGRNYEIDLTDANAEKLRAALAPFIAAGRSVAGSRGAAPRRSRSASGDLAAIRSWAQSQGYTVGDRGRISSEIRDAYDRAH